MKIQNFSIHLARLNLDLYGLSVQGAKPYPTPPLLQVEHIELGVRVVSIFQKKWYLDNLRVDSPVAHVFTDGRGVSNLPRVTSSGGSHTDIFGLGVRHALLDHGELYYNNKRIRVDADLRDLNFRAKFNGQEQVYSGSLSYRDGCLQAGPFNPVRHNFKADFSATQRAFFLKKAKLTSGPSYFTVTGTLRNYRHPAIQANYRAMLDGATFRTVFMNPSVSAGTVYASGAIQYQSGSRHSLLDSIILDGSLNSRVLEVHANRIRTHVRNIAARYSLSNGNLAINGAHANLLGGDLKGEFTVRNIGGNSHSSLKIALHGISLADLQRMTPQSGAMRKMAFDGVLTASAHAAWGKTISDLVARTDVSIYGNVRRADTGAPIQNNLPLTGALHGYYSAAGKQLTLANSYIRMPHSYLTVNGKLSKRSSLALRFKSDDLREVGNIADIVRPNSQHAVRPVSLAGTASFIGVMNGSTAAPHLRGQLLASNLEISGTRLRLLRGNVDASPSFVRIDNADLELEPRGSIKFNASAALRGWSFTKTNPIQIDLNVTNVDAVKVTQLINSRLPVEGTLAAKLHVHGTELNPMGQGSISISRAQAYGQPIQSATLLFTGTDGQVQASFTAHLTSGAIHGILRIRPHQKTYVAQLTATGIHLSQLQTLKARNIDAKGSIELNASGQGALNNPQLTALLKSSQLNIHGQAIDGLTLQMQLANHVAIATLNLHAIHSSIRAEAKIGLTGDFFTQATLDTQRILLQPLLAAYAPAQAANLNGETEVHATLRGPLKDRKHLEVHLTLPILKLHYENSIQLAAASPVHLDFSHGLFTLQRTSILGTDTNLQLQGSFPIASDRPVAVLLIGTMNLQIAQLFNPDIRSSGQLRFNINSYGARTDPNLEGQVEIVDANFRSDALPLGLQHGNGVLTLTKSRLDVKSFSAKLGGGSVTAQGGVTFRPAIQFDLGATAQDVRMLYPAGVREQLGANIRLTGTEENAVLGGRVQIENLSFTPEFDLTNFTSRITGGVAAPPSQGFSQNLRLNLAISSTNNLNLVSRTLSIGGTANLQVRGTAAQPIILGRINLNNGDVIFNGDRFTVNGGTVEFVNPSETEPVLNVSLNTTIQQYNIHLRFNGPLDQLRTNYTSDPSLPPADIIHLLAFGQTTEASAANPATPANQAAMGLVASQVSSQITSRVARIAGISQLSINPVLAGGSIQGPAGAVVTVQQRVTGNLFVTFSTNVATTQDQVIMGQYKISPRVSVSVTRDQNGGVAFDTQFNKKW